MTQDKQAEGLKEFKAGNQAQWLGFYEKAAEHYKKAAQAFAAALEEREDADGEAFQRGVAEGRATL